MSLSGDDARVKATKERYIQKLDEDGVVAL
jgi:hypothetical protein